ncbi:hypothetical protein SAMN04488137_0568 [Fictibacillus solisalsi]|uniref:Uncharacterized protein n=1 Tax=Fictibacillus solisalsi TaxID=459525 RepID=A0A1G9TXN2_9BACL|nr:hypothetical protein [Fictibacillus solisalsi]SDM52383.1 hypothetical protein SAMN04488137_0568 [Fictibacillus solisalsi]
MWDIKEKNLKGFKKICRTRLSPDGISGFMIGATVFCSLMMFFIFAALYRFGWKYYSQPIEKNIVALELTLYGLQLVFLILFLSPKAAFKLQKFQSLVLLFFAFQTGTITFTMFVLPGMTDYSTNQTTLMYIGLLIAGAFVAHILTTLDTFKQAGEGAFNDENSSFLTSKMKVWIIVGSAVYTLILAIMIISLNDYGLNIYFGYAIATIVMYAMAMGAAEFQLLAYCKFKFPSFHVSWEEHRRKRQKYSKKNVNRKSKNKRLS